MNQTQASHPAASEQQLSVGVQQLSVGVQQKKSVSLAIPRGRSSSVSAQTIVEEPQSPDVEARKAAIKRRGTHVALVKLSWWDCFKAFLTGPKNLRRKLAATVEWADPEDVGKNIFDDRENAFMLAVSVYKQDSSEYIPARCLFDTGCLQGNIISADLARRLGHTEFQPLTPRESNGGMVATGDIHQVLGAIRISWFHEASARVFGRMRFLVSESAQVDLVIGTRSIVKENLLTPPNLGVTGATYNDLALDSDTEKENLAGEIADLETKVKYAKKEVDKSKQGTEERKTAEKSLHKKEKALQIAQWKLELHECKARLNRQNSDKTERALRETIKGLEASIASKEKKKKQK
ncbi:hypothetical protein N0V90_000299 [Kalmusia sp. IMI 367209]|nr:hypothetical protein N0V90_000299 [Kalmusia sp. IMI 367209]